MFGDYLKTFSIEHYVNKLKLNQPEAKELCFFYVVCVFNSVRYIASYLFSVIHF